MADIDSILEMAPVIPVIVLDGRFDPVRLAETLVDAGLPVIEVTLRTDDALDAIRAMGSVQGAVVGAGTVLNARQMDQALAAGSRFIVSPGLTASLADSARASGAAFLPGVATAGEIMMGLDLGLDRFKFFPAEAAGGVSALKALSAPLADARFCPTGGITMASAPSWLALPSVACVGGSWMLPKSGSDYAALAAAAREAAALPR